MRVSSDNFSASSAPRSETAEPREQLGRGEPTDLRVDIVTKEYPPNVYGGAGVHVAELVKALRASGTRTCVRAFGAPQAEDDTEGFALAPQTLQASNAALETLQVDLTMVPAVAGADVVHSHTWYANFAGHLASLMYGIPHVITAHSLEPMRPWKAEQLGGGYAVSSFIEKTAYESAAAIIAVSAGMKADVMRAYPSLDEAKVHVVHNGIDADAWQADHSDEARAVATRFGLNVERPSIIFVGRMTRQKGLPYLLQAMEQVDPSVQLVLCAGAPDTPQIKEEIEGLIAQLRTQRDGVIWIPDMLPRNELVALLSHCGVFVCPSIYEPLGIVNLEAMACELPVVATATGGIPEVVVDGETGWLVPVDQQTDGTGTPRDPERFIADIACALNSAALEAKESRRRGLAGRKRAVEHFGWDAIAERTREVYRLILS